MVAVPGVKDGLLGVHWDGSGLVGVVRLPSCVLVELLVRLRDPFFLVQITILWHQVSGVPRGTCSRTPRWISLSKPVFTSSCQCSGIAIGVWQGLGVADESMFRLSNGPDIIGRCWCSKCWLHTGPGGAARAHPDWPPLLGTGGLWVGGGGTLVGHKQVWGVCLWYPSLIDSPVGLVVGFWSAGLHDGSGLEVWSAGPLIRGLLVGVDMISASVPQPCRFPRVNHVGCRGGAVLWCFAVVGLVAYLGLPSSLPCRFPWVAWVC